MSCRDRVSCYVDYWIDTVSDWLFERAKEDMEFTPWTPIYRAFQIFDGIYLRAGYLFGGPEMMWTLDNMNLGVQGPSSDPGGRIYE